MKEARSASRESSDEFFEDSFCGVEFGGFADRVGGDATGSFGEAFTDFVDEVFDDDGVYGVAVEVEGIGMESDVFGDVEELRLCDFAWHAFVWTECEDGVDFMVCPFVDGASECESGFACELVSDVIFGDFELILCAGEVLPSHGFCGGGE